MVFKVGRYFSTLIHQEIKKIDRLAPGLVVIKNGLSSQEQSDLAHLVLKLGSDPKKGFWKVDQEGKKVLNNASHRGRMYGILDSYPKLISELCRKNLIEIVEADTTLKFAMPTHVIILLYKPLPTPPPLGYIPHHQDNGENDGELDYPVVSFTLGETCDFLVNFEKPKIDIDHPLSNPINLGHRIRFESGDVLAFGGKSRKIWHGIFNFYPNTTPSFLPMLEGWRINLTFRYTPHLIGDEKRFEKISENLTKNNQFFNLTKMK